MKNTGKYSLNNKFTLGAPYCYCGLVIKGFFTQAFALKVITDCNHHWLKMMGNTAGPQNLSRYSTMLLF